VNDVRSGMFTLMVTGRMSMQGKVSIGCTSRWVVRDFDQYAIMIDVIAGTGILTFRSGDGLWQLKGRSRFERQMTDVGRIVSPLAMVHVSKSSCIGQFLT
jgi:hypothetical protein